MDKTQRITKAFVLYPAHISTIETVAKQSGRSSYSAALRKIIDRHRSAQDIMDAYFAKQVKPQEALTQLGFLLLDQLHPSPAPSGNGGESETTQHTS